MQSESTIRKRLTELRKFIDADGDGDEVAMRVAYAVESELLRIVNQTHGWPSPVKSIQDTAHLIRRDMLEPANR
jgi:hypothetical protein